LPLPTRLPKTSAPTLPGNGQTKPAFAFQRLRRSANADQPTGLNFAPSGERGDQIFNLRYFAKERANLCAPTTPLIKTG
jgi:hypothetical protein